MNDTSMSIRLIQLIKRWGLKAGWSLVDQAIVSGANFVVGILLARWLLPRDYGAFALVFSIFIFALGVFIALVLEPMSVIGPASFKSCIKRFLMAEFLIGIIVSLVLAGLLLVATLFLSFFDNSFIPAMVGLALAIPFMLLLWFVRRACYLESHPEISVVGSVIYALLLVVGLFVCRSTVGISVLNVFVLFAVSSLVAVFVPWKLLGMSVADIRLGNLRNDLIMIAVGNWRYGKWIFAANAEDWLSNSFYYVLIGMFISLQQLGAFRAMHNLALPFEQALIALTTLLLPWMAGRSGKAGVRQAGFLEGRFRILAASYGIMALGYSILLLGGGSFIVEALYRSKFYDSFLWLIPYLAAMMFVVAFRNVYGLTLRSMGHSKSIFWGKTGSVIFTFLIGIPICRFYGLRGAIIGLTLGIACELLVLSFFLRRAKTAK